ncbi:hypothetical protein [Roseicyclus persicicus]|uniref:Uncharacterized protein n=1 Tax=Roseicyclus persicicus TaxID=2650661 RepID=A0A7X6JVL5_9RHOB|nr:hypothetical protein [Roseibacterium persicicum]NKX43467.1 hypothetical protein [Roseibacterium persicicum]
MSLFNILSAALVVLILAAALVLFTGIQAANAGVFQTPAGGWGIDRPAPPPTDGPRGRGPATAAGG